MTEPMPKFPADFRWGVSTAAYQIEGAVAEDGRGPSIWDTFSHEPDRIADGSTGDVACDHYHRWSQDALLMSQLGVNAYRFSIAWPRIQPTGEGAANPAGVAFYDRLVDTLLSYGIDPVATLFHWDLPQALQDKGGWQNRDTAARLGEYAALMAEALGDRVRLWITLNEPFIHLAVGHLIGIHAPGIAGTGDLLAVAHHQLLGHGLATAALRHHQAGARVVVANNYTPVWPVGTDGTRDNATEDDLAAAYTYDALHNRLCTDPLLLGRYPDGVEALTAGDVDAVVLDGDLAVIAAPLSVLGVNYYQPTGVGAPDASGGTFPGSPIPFDLRQLSGFPTTDYGWPVVPDGLRELLVTLHERYPGMPPVWVTENGCAYDVAPGADGSIVDSDRIRYLDGHLRAVRAAMDAGVDVRGYCHWSLLDNWEWAEGFTKRFGLVHVDYASQVRTPKASFAWYRDLIARSRG
jgi:beta-glucosidase